MNSMKFNTALSLLFVLCVHCLVNFLFPQHKVNKNSFSQLYYYSYLGI